LTVPNIENKDYISGGLLSFGLATAINIIVDYLSPSTPLYGGFSLVNLFQGFLLYLFTSAAVGYYVAIKVGENQIKVAVKVGYFAFALNMILLLMHKTYEGAIWILFGYLVGGFIGGLAAKFI